MNEYKYGIGERLSIAANQHALDAQAQVNPHAPGAKLDQGKPDASLLQFFSRALLGIARVGSYGQVKYSRGGWQEVENGVDRYSAAMLRHYFLETTEGLYDSDPSLEKYGYAGQIMHHDQVAWNAVARSELIHRHLEETKNDKRR